MRPVPITSILRFEKPNGNSRSFFLFAAKIRKPKTRQIQISENLHIQISENRKLAKIRKLENSKTRIDISHSFCYNILSVSIYGFGVNGMANNKRIAAMLVAVLFCTAVLLSAFFIAAEADHDCIGETCSICCRVAICKNLLRGFGAAAVVSAVSVFCISARIGLCRCKNAFHNIFSLFTQKEMLLD